MRTVKSMPTAEIPPRSADPKNYRPWLSILLSAALVLSLAACSTSPLSPYTTDSTPLVMVPTSQAGVTDKRGRFREIFCQVLEANAATLPDYQPCEQALARVGEEPAGTGASVDLGASKRELVGVVVPGVGWDCFSEWLDLSGSVAKHVRRFGYDQTTLEVDGLSGSANNARQIRDALMREPAPKTKPRLVLIGYSKGAPDVLEALVAYPEIRPRIAAVVSVAGAVGGSPLANDAEQSQLALLQKWPGAKCSAGDGGAVDSLHPKKRRAWLAQNPLPADIPYYSMVSFPSPERISNVLVPSYNKLSRVDARNDSQMLFYDQVIPGSTLTAYLNADHWALAVPIARTHDFLGATFVDQNAYPREALMEALLRFVEEDLAQ